MDKATIQQQLDAFLAAPAVYLVGAAVIGGAVWWLCSTYYFGQYAGQIGVLKERVTLAETQRDDYKNKLSGATPDEAKARLEKLEAAVAALSPRKLLPAQQSALKAAATTAKGRISIMNDMACPDCNSYANFIRSAFAEAGWQVSAPGVMGVAQVPHSGLGASVKSPAAPSPQETAVITGLQAAGLPFDVMPQLAGMAHDQREPVDVVILVSTVQ
jgi:hypothetical protein